LLVKEDYLDPCTYGEDGDNDEKINHCSKDLNPQELKNVMVGGCQCNIHSEIWAIMHLMHGINYKKLDNSLSIVELHASEPKLLVNYLSKFLLKVVKKNGEFYPPTKFSSYSHIYFLCWFFLFE